MLSKAVPRHMEEAMITRRRTKWRIVLTTLFTFLGLVVTISPAMAGQAPDKPTGFISAPYCTPQGATIRPLAYVDMGNWTSRAAHRFVVTNNGVVVKNVTLSPMSGTSFMLDLSKKGTKTVAFKLAMTIDGKAAKDYNGRALPVVKGTLSCKPQGRINISLGEHKAGFCYNGVNVIGLYADSTMLLGKPMRLTYKLDGKTRNVTVPGNGQWSKLLPVANGKHRLTLSGTKLRTVTYVFTAANQCQPAG